LRTGPKTIDELEDELEVSRNSVIQTIGRYGEKVSPDKRLFTKVDSGSAEKIALFERRGA
jgi:hypothetical protein